jgi:hypothetical protein
MAKPAQVFRVEVLCVKPIHRTHKKNLHFITNTGQETYSLRLLTDPVRISLKWWAPRS